MTRDPTPNVATEPDDGAAEAKQERRRINELERDVQRKDKALAETAALLGPSKKLAAICRDGEDA